VSLFVSGYGRPFAYRLLGTNQFLNSFTLSYMCTDWQTRQVVVFGRSFVNILTPAKGTIRAERSLDVDIPGLLVAVGFVGWALAQLQSRTG
jgi:hypothetical protein